MNYKKLLDDIVDKQKRNVKTIGVNFPYNDVDGEYCLVKRDAWTNGYWPGLLWISYLASGEII